MKIASKIALAAALTAGLSTAAIAGGSTTPAAPPPSSGGGVSTPTNIPATLVVTVTPVTVGGGTQFQVSVNGQVIGTFTSAAIAQFVAAYF